MLTSNSKPTTILIASPNPTISVMGRYSFTLTAIQDITGNCQLRSIKYFHYLLASPYNTMEKRNEMVQKCWESVGKKNLLLIDIRQDLIDALEKFIPAEFIVSKQPYTSTNKSLMAIYLINTKEGKVFSEMKL